MNLMSYAPHGGAPRHREAAADWMRSLGVETDAGRCIVTTGAQNGMFAAFSALMRAGDTILVEKLTYPGIFPLAEMLGLKIQPVGMDADGVRPDAPLKKPAAVSRHGRSIACRPCIIQPTPSWARSAARTLPPSPSATI